MEVKDKYMNNFEDRVKMENAIKDVREVTLKVVDIHHINTHLKLLNNFLLLFFFFKTIVQHSER